MKNLFKLFGIIALIALIGFSMAVVSCEKEAEEAKDALDGTTWKASRTDGDVTMNYTLTFNSPNFIMTISDNSGQSQSMPGTYSVSGSTVTLIITDSTQTGTLSGNTLIFVGMSPFTKQ